MITGIDPTGSGFDRIAMCPPSAALPQVFDANDSSYRDRGLAIHGFLDRIAKLRVAGVEAGVAWETALEEVDEAQRQSCRDVDLALLGNLLTLSTEVALAYNWKADTGRLLQPAAPRQYEIDPTCEVALTVDVAGVGDRVVHVGDYKGPYAWLPEPEKSMQLGVGALVLARIHRARRARVEYIRIRTDGTSRKFTAELDTFGLEAVAQRTQRMMADVERMRSDLTTGVIPNVTEGPYCRYCPARQHCPAKTALVRSVLDARPVSLREALTPANVSAAYLMLRRAKEGFSLLEKAIHAYVRDGEVSTPGHVSPTAIPLGPDPDGSMRYFGMFDRLGNEKLDGSKTYEVLAKRYGADVATKAVEMETTKKAIEDVVRANLKPDEKIGATREAIVEEIRALGGSKRGKPDKPTEFTTAADGTAKATKRKAG